MLEPRQRVSHQALGFSSRPTILEILPKNLVGGWDRDRQGLAKAQEPLEKYMRGLQIPLDSVRLELQ
eukprot:3411091-Pyramimonas_sp.AAC.1